MNDHFYIHFIYVCSNIPNLTQCKIFLPIVKTVYVLTRIKIYIELELNGNVTESKKKVELKIIESHIPGY